MVAKAFVPALEICWGSTPTHRPNGDHRYARCQCVSSNNTFPELGNLECVDILERNTVLEMFSRHYNMHYFIPDQNGTNRSAEQIYSSCVNEVYEWCYSRNYFRLWAYLFVNWYDPENWKLWARSVDPDRVPVLKTTMIIESHWRKIKHDYLHQFNRPRIDLVTWVIVSRVAPQAIERMKALLKDDRRTGKAAWRKDFKKQWKHLQSSIVDPQSLLRYHTNPSKWTCSCQAFLLSRFLLCKHILCCYEFVPDPARFFREVRRQRYCPFWVGEQLSLRPEYRVQDIDLFPTASGQIPNDNTSFGSDSVEVEVIADSEDGDEDEDELVEGEDEAPQFDAKKMIEATKSILTLLKSKKKLATSNFSRSTIATKINIVQT
uniref:Uncharacterized protein AlNc14C1556G12987 n=1 Tax=Albugo laibachii Nc14 TaxID=890382 RepID=F0X2R6_9STRA|nr:hypothetical protein ACLA_058020 [Albugo laibachii Nc14]|eukprot:CCA28209.1 hypothetical protein ACLA_058020 [Albugo laibachii Nc14]